MGTSAGRKAPTGKFWRQAKASMARFSSPHNTGQVAVAEVAARYAMALADSIPETQAATGHFYHIQQVAHNLAAFYQQLARQGLAQTLKDLGLENHIGRPPQTWLPALIDRLAGPGALLEAAVARSALIDVLADELAGSTEDYYGWADRGPGNGAPAAIADQLKNFLATAVFQKLAADLGEAVEAQVEDTRTGMQRLQELRNFIKAQIFLDPAGTEPFDLAWTAPQTMAWLDGQLQQLLRGLTATYGG
ncbi:MAG: hypothetical protein PHW74_01395 [Desulfobacca sp.]|nr:hypothetical protein [Desulfobacca sp.]